MTFENPKEGSDLNFMGKTVKNKSLFQCLGLVSKKEKIVSNAKFNNDALITNIY